MANNTVEYKKGYQAAKEAIRAALEAKQSGQKLSPSASNKSIDDKLKPIPVRVEIGDRGNPDIQKAEAEERAKNAVVGDASADQIKQLKDVLSNPTIAAAAINHVKELKNQDRLAKQKAEETAYEQSPLNKFKESINSFIKNKLSSKRGTSWSKFNKNYVGTGLIKPGVVSNSPKYIPLIQVYFDVSGSWDDAKIRVGEQAIATLNQYVKRGLLKIDVYYFSTFVDANRKKAREGGGTAGKPILEHIKQTRPENVIVMTDNDIDDCSVRTVVPGGVWFLFKDGVSDNIRTYLNGALFTKSFEI